MKRCNSLWRAALFIVFINSLVQGQEEVVRETSVVMSLYDKGVMQYKARQYKEAVDVFRQVLSLKLDLAET